MKPFEFDPNANQAAICAAEWYQSQAGLGKEFLSAVAVAIEQICRDPAAQEQIRGGVRRRRLLLFPDDVIFIDKPTSVRVLAIAHHHRRPAYWLRRLRD